MRLASLDYHYSALGREHATAASHVRWHWPMTLIIDGSNRSVGLPLRRRRPALAASAVRAFAVRRVSRLSQSSALLDALTATRMLRRQLSPAAKNAIASRATSLPFERRRRAPHLDTSALFVTASDRGSIQPLRPKEGT